MGEAEHGGVQVVAGMVQEGAHAQVAHHLAELVAAQVAVQLVQEILPQDVEALALEGAVRAGGELQQHVLAGLHVHVQRAEEGLELGAFAAVEEHGEAQGLVEVAELGLAALGHLVVAVAGVDAQQADLHLVAGVVGPVALQVGVARVVLGLGVQPLQHQPVGAVAEAGDLPDALLRHGALDVEGTAQQAGHGRAVELLGTLVPDVQHAAHLVPVAGLEAAGTELDALDQVGIGEAEPLLLACPHQEGAVHLDVVHVHEVLVEVAAPHGVARAQLIAAHEAHLSAQEGLHAALGVGHQGAELRVDLLQPGLAFAPGLDVHHVQGHEGELDAQAPLLAGGQAHLLGAGHHTRETEPDGERGVSR